MSLRLKVTVYHLLLTVIFAGITALTLYAGTLNHQTGDLIADNRQCADGGTTAGEQAAAGGSEITERILPPMTGAGSAERSD